jgi:hypothetical protein
MDTLRLIGRECLGLFVDDGFLAVAVLGVLAGAMLLAGLAAPAVVVGGVLVAGILLVLVLSLWKAARAG